MVVAHLVEQLLPIPEIRDSNPNIGKILSTNSHCTIEKDENKEKEPGMANLKKNVHLLKAIDVTITEL